MDSIEIVKCDFENPSHCEALVELMNEYITDKMGGGETYNKEQRKLLVEGLKHHPSKLILFAKNGNEFIGLVNSFVNFATFTVKPFMNIHDVIVKNSWRNKGIGRKMINAVIEESQAMGCSKVTLEVREDNHNAKFLYNSLGFHDAEPRQYYWSKYL